MIWKRSFDILCSSIGLLVLLPLYLVVAVAIRLDSPGPVFFRQVRIGKGGVPFQIHKFRTMHVAQDAGAPQITVGRDPRITRVGNILRRFKIDELPQIVDVLRGKMSIVGPRPEVPKYTEFYSAASREKIFSVRPGITDESSIFFIDEATLLSKQPDPESFYIENILPVKNRYHMNYVDNVSLIRDLRIIFSTLIRIVR